jgi:hypothetical protein
MMMTKFLGLRLAGRVAILLGLAGAFSGCGMHQVGNGDFEVATERLNLRACPAPDCRVVAELDEGSELKFLSTKGDWVEVYAGMFSRRGWVHRNFITGDMAKLPPQLGSSARARLGRGYYQQPEYNNGYSNGGYAPAPQQPRPYGNPYGYRQAPGYGRPPQAVGVPPYEEEQWVY